MVSRLLHDETSGLFQKSSLLPSQREDSVRNVAQDTLPVNSSSPNIKHSNLFNRQEVDAEFLPEHKYLGAKRVRKSLDYYSMKICENVRKKRTTSIREIENELLGELFIPADQLYERKNVRRRVYDCLNVMLAMNIISKEKKVIKWLGLPADCLQHLPNLEKEKQQYIERIEHKTQRLQQLLLQKELVQNLIERNKIKEEHEGSPPSDSRIQLPFTLVCTSKKNLIGFSMSHDKLQYSFNFDSSYEIHDDIHVLKAMEEVLGSLKFIIVSLFSYNGTRRGLQVRYRKILVSQKL